MLQLEENKPVISIIIPCFNHGHFIKDALDSILKFPGIKQEIIIVDDGSTDPNTITVLTELKNDGFLVFRQENKGLSAARNTAIRLARGKYILPLDCDNKILPNYIPLAVNFLNENKNFDVVYGDRILFGNKTGIVLSRKFCLHNLITGNFIDACAVYRKSAWEKIGGYDESKTMRMGVEDWEFWLNLAFNGFKFHYINEPVFMYRLTGTSMVDQDTKPNFGILRDYIESKHSYFINYNAPADHIIEKFKANPIVLILKLVLGAYFPKRYQSLVQQRKIKRI
jgi:glycosyltransferase involved in cell wall biosynthesis